ncbi:MAG: glutathione S-transferase family protein [Dongiaceae bacterium]
MYRLYGNPGAASMTPHVVLMEANAPHEFIVIDLDKGEQFDPEFLKINPHARVPVLIDGDLVLHQSAAITLHLCERYPHLELVPAPSSPQRAKFLQWMMYLTNTVQEEHMHYWHADHYMESDSGRREMVQMAEKRLGDMWAHIDGAIASGGHPYLLGDRCTAADIYLTMLTRWSRKLAKPPASYPHLKGLVDRVKARPAYQATLKAEGIDQ